MRLTMWRGLTLVAILASTLLASGCAKKAAETPPEPPPAPPAEQPVVQPPTPAEQPPPTPPTPRVTSSDFQPVFFDLDSYTLRDDARNVLDADARLLRENPEVHVVIEGHADERGTSEYNQALGERRAKAAYDYLVGAGIGAPRMTIISYGKERPFDMGHDEAAWSKNRRAHFAVQ